ncbi:hypothetical protein PybrP1_007254 [[Pythium] brassicae (nom. inval.)]|nr:hypothetical protein PybrP1_007254 [[Pythium] brassicae (nom. inval.)]
MLRKLLRRSAAAHGAPPQSRFRAQTLALVHTNAYEQVADADEHRATEKPQSDGHVLLNGGRTRATVGANKPPSDGHVLLSGARDRATASAEKQPSDGHVLLNGARGRASSASAQASDSTAQNPTHLSLISLNGSVLGATAKDIEAAKEALRSLGASVEAASPRVDGESEYQKLKRLQKAMTGPLDKLLYRWRQRKEFALIEAVALVWEDVFPQFASNAKHRTIICENYAHGLNQRQRFRDVVDKLLTRPLAAAAPDAALVLSPHLAESIWFACGHLADSVSALQLLDVVRATNVRMTKVAYFHLLNTLLKEEAAAVKLGTVLQLCEELVHTLHGAVPVSLLPTVLRLAAERDELDRAMQVYQHDPDAAMSSFTEFRFEICVQALCDRGYLSAMLEVYRNVMASRTATRGLKERMSKCLLGRCLRDRQPEHRDAVIDAALAITQAMEEHRIASNHHCVFPFLRTLLQTGRVKSTEDLAAFFSAHAHVIELNAFAICEALIACVYCKEAQLVDGLLAHALDANISIKYAALESVVAFYYKLGMLGDLEKVSDIVRALRLNKHIPLGIAVTEIGMSANFRLGRFEEVVHLFEDFAAMDGDRKRVLKRRLMLKSALNAYASLNRLDESNAVRALLRSSYGNVLERPAESAEGDADADAAGSVASADDDSDGDGDYEHDGFFTESVDKRAIDG